MTREILLSAARALSFSAGRGLHDGANARDLCSYTADEWSREIGALDRSGLTLPLYARMLERGATATLPKHVTEMLEQRRRDNTHRMTAMLETFQQAAQALEQANVLFACLKGFSLVPDFAPELWQRHQIDFDLLIAPEAMDRAQLALERLGYVFTGGDRDERRLRVPMAQAHSRDTYLYEVQQGPAIELHSRFWEAGGVDLAIRGPEDALDQAEMHKVGSASFLRLSRPYAFFYQALHFFRHFMASWARPLWLYEIAAFTHRHCDDEALWRAVRKLAKADEGATEAVALTLISAQRIFDSPIPAGLKNMCDLPSNSPITPWVEHYAERWLLADMPGNKLNLLLHRHFIADDRAWRRYLVRRLAPMGSRPELCEGIAAASRKSLRFRAADLRYKVERLGYHVGASAQFAAQSIVWKRLSSASSRSFPPAALRRSEP